MGKRGNEFMMLFECNHDDSATRDVLSIIQDPIQALLHRLPISFMTPNTIPVLSLQNSNNHSHR